MSWYYWSAYTRLNNHLVFDIERILVADSTYTLYYKDHEGEQHWRGCVMATDPETAQQQAFNTIRANYHGSF